MLKKHIVVKGYYKQLRRIISNDFSATLNIFASFFEYRTRLNNNGFLVN